MADQHEEKKTRRLSVRYEGRVQGVGFRYTAVGVASRLPVTGYIQNEPDGSVTLVAEGSEADLARLLQGIRDSHLGRYVSAERIAWANATGEFTGFGIRHAWW